MKKDMVEDFVNDEYNRLVELCCKHRLDFDIPCSSKKHREFILSKMQVVKDVMIKGVRYVIGKKHAYLVHNKKRNKAWANFNGDKVCDSIMLKLTEVR